MTVPGKGGRPLKFESPEELQEKIDAYFDSCYKTVIDADGNKVRECIRPLTVSGLAVALDCDRDTLLNYEAKEEYFGTIKRAKEKIQQFAEEQLYTNRQTAGVIFSLVNNYKWANRQEIDHSGGLTLSFEDQLKSVISDDD